MNIKDYQGEFDKTIEFYKSEIAALRTGRATSAIVEDVGVTAYGTKQPLKSVASITVADAKTLNIEPWDKSILQEVEKGIRESGLGLNPINDGRLIRLCLPELTVERRQELIRVARIKQENARIALRRVREEVRDKILAAEKDKQIAEDERYKLQDELDKLVKDFNEKIKELGDKKEAEINAV